MYSLFILLLSLKKKESTARIKFQKQKLYNTKMVQWNLITNQQKWKTVPIVDVNQVAYL